jgi:hypothetical protein
MNTQNKKQKFNQNVLVGPLLDSTYVNKSTSKEWTTKQNIAYHRIKSGIERHQGEKLRFLTLTSSKSSCRQIRKDFQVLLRRIRRLSIDMPPNSGQI